MRKRGHVIARWAVTVFITLVIVGAIATASAQNQPADLPELPVPVPRPYKIAPFVVGKSLPSGFSGLNPAIHSFGHIDLTTEGLGLLQSQTGSDSHMGSAWVT